MPTFGKLRETVLKEAGIKEEEGIAGMFRFRSMHDAYDEFWERMNTVEWQRGYRPGYYERSDTPALCQMDLLTQEEFDEWVKSFKAIKKRIDS